MNVSPQSQARTRMAARVIGPYVVIACAAALVRASDIQTLFLEIDANSLWTWVSGVLALLFGLVVVALHPYWHGAAAITVSVLGWVAVLKGLLLLTAPSLLVSFADTVTGTQALWFAYCIVFGLVGVYLTYVGWVAPTATSASQPTGSSSDELQPSA